MAGKTRAIYQALVNSPKPCDVIIPRLVDVNLEDFRIPWHLTFWRQKVLLLNDLDKYLEKQNVKYLIQGFLEDGAIIAASCRAGGEYKRVLKALEGELALFVDPVEIPRLDREKGREIARAAGQSLPVSFDGNVGSILLPLDTMKARFHEIGEEEKAILRALKRLLSGGHLPRAGSFYSGPGGGGRWKAGRPGNAALRMGTGV